MIIHRMRLFNLSCLVMVHLILLMLKKTKVVDLYWKFFSRWRRLVYVRETRFHESMYLSMHMAKHFWKILKGVKSSISWYSFNVTYFPLSMVTGQLLWGIISHIKISIYNYKLVSSICNLNFWYKISNHFSSNRKHLLRETLMYAFSCYCSKVTHAELKLLAISTPCLKDPKQLKISAETFCMMVYLFVLQKQ